MIFVDRTRVKEPEILKSVLFQNIRNEIQNFYMKSPKLLKQMKIESIPKFKKYQLDIYHDREVLATLKDLFYNKCAYCETKLSYVEPGENDAFRPTGGAKNGKIYDHLHYGWLFSEWDNMLLSCRVCSIAKASSFPVIGDRALYGSSIEQIRHMEKSLLLDPCYDNPQEHISFNEDGEATAITERGSVTIRILELNRPSLVNERSISIRIFQAKVAKYADLTKLARKGEISIDKMKVLFNEDILSKLSAPETVFLGCLRAVSRKELFKNKIIQKFNNDYEIPWDILFTLKENSRKPAIKVKHKNQYRVIKKIIVHHLKGMSDFEIELNDDEQHNWLMILGENATGKSTLLKLIAMNLIGRKERERGYSLLPEEILEEGNEYGSICLVFSGEPLYERELTFSRDGYWGGSADQPYDMPVLGYGSIRIPSKQSGNRKGGVRNLFSPHSTLINTNKWMLDCYEKDETLFSAAVRCIRAVMPLENKKDYEFLLRPEGDTLVFENLYRKSDRISFDVLSSGYQNIFTLVSDIFHKMKQSDSHLARGIVLLDEIDVHLHPRWKMSIVTQLKELFSNVQFITTSHDPLCLRGLTKGEIMVLDRQNNNIHIHFDNLPTPEGLRTDQLLTSEYFGLNSTMDKKSEDLFVEYYALLEKRVLIEDENNRLIEIKQDLKDLNYMGIGKRERLMYEVIDRYLAESKSLSTRELKETSLKSNMFEKIESIWENAGKGGSDDKS